MNKPLQPIGILIVVLFSFSLKAQTILSSNGVGSPYLLNNSRSMGMGSVSIAAADRITINRINPGSLSRIFNTRISLEYLMIQNNYQTDEGRETDVYSNFNGFSFALPIGSRIAFSVGLYPVTRMDYNLSYSGTNQDMAYTRSVKGTGGLNIFSMAMSVGILKNLSVGFAGRYFFGNLKESWVLVYDEAGFVESNDNYITKNDGFGWTLGIAYSPLPGTELGAVYTPFTNLENETEMFYTYYINLGIASQIHSGTIRYPSSWGVGVSQQIFRTIQLGIDYTSTDWAAMKINEEPIKNLIQTNRFAVGFEIRKTLNLSESLLERIAYRMGYFTQPYFSQDPEGNNITEHWFSAGLGIPLLRNASQIDIAVQYGKRGSLKTNGIEEKLLRLHLSISGGERWFIQRY